MVAGFVGKEGDSVVYYQDWGTHGFLRKHSSGLHCLAPVCLLCELVCFFADGLDSRTESFTLCRFPVSMKS